MMFTVKTSATLVRELHSVHIDALFYTFCIFRHNK